MTYYASFTRVSGNSKTGPIPVTMTMKATCPNACPLKQNGCYAEIGHVNIHWDKLGRNKLPAKGFIGPMQGFNGLSWGTLLESIRTIPKGQLWRHNVSGDLPGDGEDIDIEALTGLINANRNRKGFTYTHYNPIGNAWNTQSINLANVNGFTVNLSANNLEHADKLAALGIGPVVTLLPEDASTLSYTPQGRAVVVCPAVRNESVTCSTCGLCQKVDRKSIVGFPVHGIAKKKAHKVFSIKVTY